MNTNGVTSTGYKTWKQFDPESASNGEGGTQHFASVKNNAVAMVEDAFHILPDRMFTMAGNSLIDPSSSIIEGFVLGFGVDIVEILIYPLTLLKNLHDILFHFFAGLFNGTQECTAEENPHLELDILHKADSGFRLVMKEQNANNFLDLPGRLNRSAAAATTHYALAAPTSKGVVTR